MGGGGGAYNAGMVGGRNNRTAPSVRTGDAKKYEGYNSTTCNRETTTYQPTSREPSKNERDRGRGSRGSNIYQGTGQEGGKKE